MKTVRRTVVSTIVGMSRSRSVSRRVRRKQWYIYSCGEDRSNEVTTGAVSSK